MFDFTFLNVDWSQIFTPERITTIIKVGILLLIGLPILFLLRKWARSFFSRKYAPHYGMLSGKIVFYLGLTMITVMVMQQLGFSLAPLLGAAGIVGVALGFASQTSVSNVISGLFLIAEQPFKVDDIIAIGNTSGVVMSIDVLSVKLRTFDNRMVRIPNESIIKTEVTNNTRFPIRRFNANVSVAYKEDIGRIRDVLKDVADKNPHALREPEPIILFDKFGTSSIDLLLLVWAPREEWLNLKNTILEDIKARFDEEGIEIPFPHVSLYSGQATDPIPVSISNQNDSKN